MAKTKEETIEKIFERCLIKDGYRPPLLEPVRFGKYCFDTGMINNYGCLIIENYEKLKNGPRKL